MDTLSLLVASLCAGFLPMVFWAALIWWLDRYEKEPLLLMGLAFLWGAVPATLFAVISEFLLNIPLWHWIGNHSLPFLFLSTGFLGPIIEESVKAFGIFCLFLLARSEIDGPLDGIIYAALVGLGFTATENMLFFLTSQSSSEWLGLVIMRSFVFGLNHAVFAALIGFGFVLAINAQRWSLRLGWFLGGWLSAIFFHSLFNCALLFASSFPVFFLAGLLDSSLGLFLVFVLFLLGLRHDREIMRRYLPFYVEAGLISSAEFATVQSITARFLFEWRLLLSFDFTRYRRSSLLFNLSAELALKENQKAIWGSSPVMEQKIHKICRKISHISPSKNSASFPLV
jgi:protease PrsW